MTRRRLQCRPVFDVRQAGDAANERGQAIGGPVFVVRSREHGLCRRAAELVAVVLGGDHARAVEWRLAVRRMLSDGHPPVLRKVFQEQLADTILAADAVGRECGQPVHPFVDGVWNGVTAHANAVHRLARQPLQDLVGGQPEVLTVHVIDSGQDCIRVAVPKLDDLRGIRLGGHRVALGVDPCGVRAGQPEGLRLIREATETEIATFCRRADHLPAGEIHPDATVQVLGQDFLPLATERARVPDQVQEFRGDRLASNRVVEQHVPFGDTRSVLSQTV